MDLGRHDDREWDHRGRNGELPRSTPSIPAHHLWLTDGVYSTFYFTPGATDSVLLAGPSVGRTFDPQSDLG